MTTSELVRRIAREQNVSLAEVARRIGQSRQNLYKKMQRETLTLEELKAIADVLGVRFEQSFILPNGDEYKTGNNTDKAKLEEISDIVFSRAGLERFDFEYKAHGKFACYRNTDGSFYRLDTFGNNIVIEYAENQQDAEHGLFEDTDLFDATLKEEKLIRQITKWLKKKAVTEEE